MLGRYQSVIKVARQQVRNPWHADYFSENIKYIRSSYYFLAVKHRRFL